VDRKFTLVLVYSPRSLVSVSEEGIFFFSMHLFLLLEFNSLTTIVVKQLCSQLLSTSSKIITTVVVISQNSVCSIINS